MSDDRNGADPASRDGSDEPGASNGSTTSQPAASSSLRVSKILIGLTTVFAVVAIFTVGLKTQVLDTDEWVTLSTEILDDPDVQEAVADHIVDVLYTQLDVGAGLGDLLPDDIRGLGGPLAGALRDPFTDGVVRLLDSAEFQSLWESSNRTAHETMVKILRDETGAPISTADGSVTLEFNGLVLAVGEALGLPQALLDQLPEDAGNIVVLESDELDTVQGLVRVMDVLAWFLLALIIVLYALAVYLARGRRLAMLRRVGWSILGVGVIVLIARAIAIRTLVNAIVEDPIGRPSAENVFSIGTSLLRQMGWSALIYGVLIVAFTSLMGDGSWARSVRRTLAPGLSSTTGAVTAAGMILLVLIWWQPGRAFEGWITGLTLIALVIGAVIAVRTKTVDEFPDTTFDDVLAGLPFRGGSSPT